MVSRGLEIFKNCRTSFEKKFGWQFSIPPQFWKAFGYNTTDNGMTKHLKDYLNVLLWIICSDGPAGFEKKKFGRWFPIRPRIFRATYISSTTNVTANQASTGTIKGASKSSILLSCAYQIFPLMLLLLHALIHEHVQLCKSCCN